MNVPLTNAQAEAGKALAETTGKALDLTKGIGSYLAETIGAIPQDLLGVAGGDWLHEKRQRNLAQMRAKTARILEGVEKERISEPSPSVVMPLLEAAKDEGREELQGLWAALLAQAMVDGGHRVRRSLFTLTAALEPMDAAVLKVLADTPRPSGSPLDDDPTAVRSWTEEQRLKISATKVQWRMTIETLVDLACITTVSSGIPRFTTLGQALMEAISFPPASEPSQGTV